MIIDDVSVRESAGSTCLSGALRHPEFGDVRMHYTFRDVAGDRFLDGPLQPGNAFVPALTLPAMALGEEVAVTAAVSPRLLWGARSVMELYQRWWNVEPVPLVTPVAEPVDVGLGRPRGTGLFFTAGVDSYYCLLKDLERASLPGHAALTHLVFANVNEDHGPAQDRLIGRLTEVAERTGKRLLVVETNVRTVTAGVVGWNEYHGAALSSVALALEGVLGRCLIASTEDYGHLPPWGSHPLLDPQWSTDRLEIVHDGVESSRVEKITMRVARSPLAMDTLSVCWRTDPDRNCGVCDKCVSTMVALELGGALGRCGTLPPALDLDLVSSQRLWGWAQCDSWRELAVHVARHGRTDIGDAVAHALSRAQESNGWKPKFASRCN